MRITSVLTIFFMLCIANVSFGQDAEYVLEKSAHRSIKTYEFSQNFAGQVLLKMPYSKADLLNQADASLLNKVKINKVELVYTIFPNTPDFQNGRQKELNIERLNMLKEAIPALFGAETKVQWVIVGQECESAEKAKEMFHGFVIHYEFKQ